jgi:O-antigen/teichoic acid export membrane protein
MGPTAVGEYAAVAIITQLTAAFFSPGFDQAVIREPHDRSLKAAALAGTLVQSSVIAVAAGLVFVVWQSYSTVGAFPPAAVIIIILSLSIGPLGHLAAAPIAGDLNYKFLAISRMASSTIASILGVVAAYIGKTSYALPIRDLAASLIYLILCASKVERTLFSGATPEALKKLFDFSKGLWALNFAERAVYRVELAAIDFLVGPQSMGGVFVIRGLVDGLLSFVINPIQTILYAYSSQKHRSGDFTVRTGVWTTAAYWIIVFCSAALSCMVAPHLTGALLGDDFMFASDLIPPLVIYSGAVIWFEYVKVQALASLRHNFLFLARIVQIAVFLGLIFQLADRIGIFGIGVSICAAAVALAVVATLMVRNSVRQPSSAIK